MDPLLRARERVERLIALKDQERRAFERLRATLNEIRTLHAKVELTRFSLTVGTYMDGIKGALGADPGTAFLSPEMLRDEEP